MSFLLKNFVLGDIFREFLATMRLTMSPVNFMSSLTTVAAFLTQMHLTGRV